MSNKDLSQNLNFNELDRLKGILFPKKQKTINTTATVSLFQQPLPKTQLPIGTSIRSEIEKLRGQINSMLQKGPTETGEVQQTERTYLDGINKMTKGLRNHSAQISDVFDEFVAHLPTNLSIDHKNYTTHYFLSMLLQNCIWSKIDSLINRNVAQAFREIKDEAERIREQEETEIQIQNERQLRIKNRIQGRLSKYFWTWRFNSNCMAFEERNSTFLRQNCLENDRKVIQHVNNLPLLVLLLEQICRNSNSDISQILLYDNKNNTFLKFFQQGFDCLNTSLQTVTQRSLLNGELAHKKFKRFEFVSKRSLTALCVSRGQILFVPNILKHPDYAEVDNNCMWQSTHSPRVLTQNDSLVLYPLFDRSGELIAVIRQYFSQKIGHHIPQQKLEKVSSLIQQALQFERHSRMIQKEKHYQKENYYFKMIRIIKQLENSKGHQTAPFEVLAEQMQSLFNVQEVSVYRLAKHECARKQKMLEIIWGNSDRCEQLLPIVDKFMKQGIDHLYLKDRLVVYSNMMLFDIKLTPTSDSQKNIELLPVELFARTMSKVEQILSQKQKEHSLLVEKQERKARVIEEERTEQYRKELEHLSCIFIASAEKDKSLFAQTEQFIIKVTELSQRYKKQKPSEPLLFYVRIILDPKDNTQKTYILKQQQWQECELDPTDKQKTMILKINNTLTILLNFQWSSILFTNILQKTISRFIKSYIQLQLSAQNRSIQPIFTQTQKQEVVDHSIKHINSMEAKRQWQLIQLTNIYKKIKKNVQCFVSQAFLTQEAIECHRQTPQKCNAEQWKNIVYSYQQASPQKIQISIDTLQSTVNTQQYAQSQIIFPSIRTLIPNKSILNITISRKALAGRKMTHDPYSIAFGLPIYFTQRNISQASEINRSVKMFLERIKEEWIANCQRFTAVSSAIGANIVGHNASRMTGIVVSLAQSRLRQCWDTIKQYCIIHQQRINQIHRVSKTIKRAITRQLSVHFPSFKCQRKCVKYSSSEMTRALSQLYQSFSTKIFRTPFDLMIKLKHKKIAAQQCFRLVRRVADRCEKWNIQVSYDHLFYRAHQLSEKQLAINSLLFIHKTKLSLCFQQLKQCPAKQLPNTNQEDKSTLEEVTTLHDLSQAIHCILPEYKLYLAVDSMSAFLLSTHSLGDGMINLEEVMNPQAYNLYQAGSQGQLVWHCPAPLDNFTIKDQLNRLSKKIQQVLKKCKASYQLMLSSMTLFKSKFTNSIKSRYFRCWREQRQQLAMAEKNRLNDSLYQLTVENQTMRDKLSIQEKTLKSNLSMHKHIDHKMLQYKSLIAFSRQRVQQLQQASFKLHNSRNVLDTLHRRTVLKNIMLVWRSNAQGLKLLQKMVNRKVTTYQRMATKSIVSVLATKYQQALRKVFQAITSIRKGKDIMVSKLTVSFDENTDRLVTFQSELPKEFSIDCNPLSIVQKEKENSSHNSNVSSPDSKNTFKSIGKLQLNKMNQQKRLGDLSAEELIKHNNGIYKLNPKTLKFLKRMGKLQH